MAERDTRTRVIFQCGQPGHITVNHTTPVGPYHLHQPVVNGAEKSELVAGSVEVYVCSKGVNTVTTEPVLHQQGGTKMAEVCDFGMLQESKTDQPSSTELTGSTMDLDPSEAITKYWKVCRSCK